MRIVKIGVDFLRRIEVLWVVPGRSLTTPGSVLAFRNAPTSHPALSPISDFVGLRRYPCEKRHSFPSLFVTTQQPPLAYYCACYVATRASRYRPNNEHPQPTTSSAR